MAFQDLLDAITSDTDARIQAEQAALRQRLSTQREESERRLSTRKQDIHRQRDARKEQLWRKAETMADVEERNLLLHTKKALLDSLYEAVVQHLCALDATAQKKLLNALLESAPKDGIVHPAKPHAALVESLAAAHGLTVGDAIDAQGGFVCISKKEERDCTYEFLVRTRIQPATDIQAAHQLFSAA